MHLQLCIPGLLWTHTESTGQKPSNLNTPALDAMIRFGQTQRVPISLTELQANLRRHESLLATAKQDLQISPQTPAFFASPCIQKLEMNSINLIAGHNLQLQQEEAESLCDSLTEFLPDLHWVFYPWQPDLWLVTCPNHPQWETPIITETLGQIDRDSRPIGEEARLIMRTQAEVQMFFNTHPVNQSRKAHKMEINGIWFWRDLMPQQSAWQERNMGILATDSLLLQDNHPLTQSMPYDFAAYQRLHQEMPEAQNKVTVLNIEDLLLPSMFADIWGYQDCLNHLETRFFMPIWQALQTGEVKSATIITNGEPGLITHIKAKAHRAFWKRKTSFSQFI